MDTGLEIRIFKKEDFPEYLSWFQDAELNELLGPMKEEDEWLASTLNQQNDLAESKASTYSVFRKENLISVIGIDYPNNEYPSYCISSFAVKPSLRDKGIGTRILQKVMKLHPLKNDEYWMAYVDRKNSRAKLFFEKNGWKCETESLEEKDMHLLVFRIAIKLSNIHRK